MKSPISKAAPAPNSNSEPPRSRLHRCDLPADTLELARFLIGIYLVRRNDSGALDVGRIVETEAYAIDDPASHAYRGPTKRNRAMFEAHAHVYVYLIYGTSYCLNVSTEARGVGAGVLIRAAEPIAGIDRMRARRNRAGLRDDELARGPGNLTRAFAIGAGFDGLDLDTAEQLELRADGARPEVGVSTRIGLTCGLESRYRFYARGSRAVSGPRSLSP